MKTNIKDTIMNLVNDKDYVLGHIMPRLVTNEKFESIGDPYLDMKVLYYIECEGFTTTFVTNDTGLTHEEIRMAALENLKRETITMDLGSFLTSISGENFEATTDLKIISTKSMHFGAAAMLDTDILDRVANGSKIYVLPSSIHEVIAVDAAISMDVKDLRNMVTSINRDVVEDNEILSDNVFLYDPLTKKMSIA